MPSPRQEQLQSALGKASATPLLASRNVGLSIALYSLASSSMLLVNKALVEHVDSPGLVVSIQLLFTSVAVGLASKLRCFGFEPVTWSWRVVRLYLLYVGLFVSGVYANMRALKASNVETVIVFRACTPLAVAGLDYYFMGRDVPSWRSTTALLLLVVGSLAYVEADREFHMSGFQAYFWVALYFVCIVAQMTLGKVILHDQSVSISAAVLYNNALAFLPMLGLSIAFGEDPLAFRVRSGTGMALLAVSCITGTLIGYCGWWCRSLMSATAYTVVGVSNKFITIAVNRVLWPSSSGVGGLLAVLFCVFASSIYRQAPLRSKKHEPALPEA